jgi:uncharacterized protein YcbK (DUF882 family)
MNFVPIYFKSFELVPADIFSLYGDNSFYFMDTRILWTIDQLRKYYNKIITVNNWKSGGSFSQRGYRNDPNTGAKFSAHRFGRACDFDIQGTTSEEFRNMVRAGKLKEQLKYITRIEEGVNWVHIDVAGLPRDFDEDIDFFKA